MIIHAMSDETSTFTNRTYKQTLDPNDYFPAAVTCPDCGGLRRELVTVEEAKTDGSRSVCGTCRGRGYVSMNDKKTFVRGM